MYYEQQIFVFVRYIFVFLLYVYLTIKLFLFTCVHYSIWRYFVQGCGCFSEIGKHLTPYMIGFVFTLCHRFNLFVQRMFSCVNMSFD